MIFMILHDDAQDLHGKQVESVVLSMHHLPDPALQSAQVVIHSAPQTGKRRRV